MLPDDIRISRQYRKYFNKIKEHHKIKRVNWKHCFSRKTWESFRIANSDYSWADIPPEFSVNDAKSRLKDIISDLDPILTNEDLEVILYCNTRTAKNFAIQAKKYLSSNYNVKVSSLKLSHLKYLQHLINLPDAPELHYYNAPVTSLILRAETLTGDSDGEFISLSDGFVVFNGQIGKSSLKLESFSVYRFNEDLDLTEVFNTDKYLSYFQINHAASKAKDPAAKANELRERNHKILKDNNISFTTIDLFKLHRPLTKREKTVARKHAKIFVIKAKHNTKSFKGWHGLGGY